MKAVKKWWWLILVVLLAGFLRIYRLEEVPAGLYYDEIDLAYQARSMLETGRDYRGNLSPFYFWSMLDPKTPLPIYLSVPAMAVFGLGEIQARATVAVAGVVVVVLGALLTLRWTKKKEAAFLVGMVMALNPWLIQFSRIAFEAMFALMVYLAFLVMFYYWLKTKKIWAFYLAIILLSLGMYSYRIMSFFVPLTFLMVGVIYGREILKVGIKHLCLGLALAGAIILSFLYFTVVETPDKTRFEQLSIFSDPLAPIWVIRGREVDSGDHLQVMIGNQPVWYSYLFHNKGVEYLSSLKNNYLKSISSTFLFATGDANLRQGMGKTGALLWIDIVGLAAGLYWLGKNIRRKENQLLAGWLLTSPLPAGLTVDGATHASRLILMAAPLLIVAGIGWWQIWKKLSFWRWGGVTKMAMAGVYLLVFINMAHKYFVHFPLEAARWHGYGYKEAMLKIKEVEDEYDKVMLTNSNDPAILYYLYWTQVPPKEVQEYGVEFGEEIIKGKELDRVKMMSWSKVTEGKEMPHEMGEALEEGVLYLITQQDAKSDIRPGKGGPPAGVKIIESIPYPDNSEVAYFLVSKE